MRKKIAYILLFSMLIGQDSVIAGQLKEDISYYNKPFSSNSPWNQSIIERYSYNGREELAYIESIMPNNITINSNTWSIPVYKAVKEDPIRKIFISEINDSVNVKMPDGIKEAGGTDGHLAVFSPDSKFIHEFYKFKNNKAKIYKKVKADGLGVATNRYQNIGTRAYGGSSVGGLLRSWEVRDKNSIQHALALAISKQYLKEGFIKPATLEDSFSNSKYSGFIPMGSHITLKAGINYEEMLSNRLAIKIANALYDYGGYVVDSGGSNKIIIYAEPGLDNKIIRDATIELKKILQYLVVVRD
ncbi:MAG: hypothetical protein AB2708_13050 [Candidatus Thiodiazotropha taylori]